MEGKLPPHIQKGLAFDIGAGPVPGEMHLAAGQEPVAVGVCAHLRADDTVVATHRPHHFAIAKGVPINAMTAEIFGKATGLSAGKGGHMHLFDPAHKFSCSGIEGASMPPACGAAMAAKRLGSDCVAIAVLGEGAANQGTFHESLNLAGVWKLPVVFVVEDNGWAISVKKEIATAVASNAARGAAYDMPGIDVLENDPLAVYAAAGEAIERARKGGGPTIIEVKTHRLLGHFQGDGEVYRPKEEIRALREIDPIPGLERRLRDEEVLDDGRVEEIEARASRTVADAYAFARESVLPSPDDALENVFL
jgi:acetoin:2,6-dichlorophenolindophenol oxidoreductase subunit alpha